MVELGSTLAGHEQLLRLFVGNGLDSTVTRIDTASGRVIGLALPAGVAPHQIVPGLGESVLVLSAGAIDRRLPHVTPSGYSYSARSIPLDPGASGAKLAGDGRGRAVLSYHVPESTSDDEGGRTLTCRLALLDAERGAVPPFHSSASSPSRSAPALPSLLSLLSLNLSSRAP